MAGARSVGLIVGSEEKVRHTAAYMRACMGALELGHGTTVLGGMGSRVREAGSISPWCYLSRLPWMGRGGGGCGVIPSTPSTARPVSHGRGGGMAVGVGVYVYADMHAHVWMYVQCEVSV